MTKKAPPPETDTQHHKKDEDKPWLLGRMFDGAVSAEVNGRPFGLAESMLKGDNNRPDPSGNKWFMLWSADDDAKKPGNTPGQKGKKKQGTSV